MTKSLLALFALTCLAACGETPDPAKFATGHENMAGLTFSPDGKSAYWSAWDGQWGSGNAGSKTIFVSHREGRGWTSPEPMPFSGEHSDDDPFVSLDGEWLYFISEGPEADIWRYRLGSGEDPERLGINSDAAEYSPVVVASGALYFASAREGGIGQGDIYRAAADGEGFSEPELLGTAINSETGEWNVWVSPDESRLIFEASSRPTNVSVPGDLYISCRIGSDWSEAKSLARLNTEGSDLLPRVYPDGETLFFTSAPIGGHASVYSTGMPSCL